MLFSATKDNHWELTEAGNLMYLAFVVIATATSIITLRSKFIIVTGLASIVNRLF